MPISVTCPDCDARLNAPDAAAGKSVKCPKCGGRISIPDVAAAEVVEPKPATKRPRPADDEDDDEPRSLKKRRDDEDDEDDDRPRKKGKKKGREKAGTPVWVFAAGGGVLLAIVAIVLVIALGGKKDEKTAGGDGKTPAGGDGKAPGPTGETVPAGWTEVTDPEAGFRVLLPGEIVKRNQSQSNNPKDRIATRWVWNERTGHDPKKPYAQARAVVLKDGTTPGDDPDKLLAELGKLAPGAYAGDEVESKQPRAASGKTGLVVRFKERVFGANHPEFRIDPNTPKEIQDSFRQANEDMKKRVAEDRARVEREGRRAVYYIVADDKKIYLVSFETTGPVDEKTVTTILDSFRLL